MPYETRDASGGAYLTGIRSHRRIAVRGVERCTTSRHNVKEKAKGPIVNGKRGVIRLRIAVAALVTLGAAIVDVPAVAQDASLKLVQERLTEAGYDPGPADGFDGPRTRRAIEAYQRDKRLAVTGTADAATLDALRVLQEPPTPTVINASSDAPSLRDNAAGSAFAQTAERASTTTPDASSRLALVAALIAVAIGVFWMRRRKRASAINAPPAPAPKTRAEREGQRRSEAAELLDRALGRLDAGGHTSAAAQLSTRGADAVRSASDKATPSNQTKARGWVAAGSTATVAGRAIGGMVYLGPGPRDKRGGAPCGAFIDPSLSVAKKGGDLDGSGMSYWPKYSQMSAVSRATYLDWLASGRQDPGYNVGYMFLYFYGLERRFLVDDPDRDEREQIVREVERLLSIYGGNGSVSTYLGRFLDVARLALLDDDTIPSVSRTAFEFPVVLAVALGRKIARGEALNADWVRAWWRAHPEAQVRTPARRCEAEFNALFSVLFAEAYPSGMAITRPKRTLSGAYRAASGEFSADYAPLEAGEALPDVSGLRKPVTDAQRLADQAMERLDKFSRFLGRTPDGRGSFEAFALLPAEIRDAFPSSGIDAIASWAKDIVTNGGDIGAGALIQRLEGARPEKLTRKHLTGAADALAMVGHGLAPDPRFALRPPRLDEPVILFRLQDQAAVAEGASDAYRAALLRLGLGVFVAQADGDVATSEREALAEAIKNADDVTADERARLAANLRWMLTVPPNMTAFRARLKALGAEEKGIVRASVVAMAHADGVIRPGEINGLEKLYKAMGLDPHTVYSDLHAGTASDAPVPVRTATGGLGGEAIPDEAAPANGLSLDRSRIADIADQTERVSRVLGDILGAEEPDDTEETDDEGAVLGGLAPVHAGIVVELLAKPHWTDDEMQELIGRRGLMIDGALEAINEWSFDRFDDALIDAYEGYDLHPDISKQIEEARAVSYG